MLVLDARTANAHYPGIGRYTYELARALAAHTELVILFDPTASAPEFRLTALPVKRIAVPVSPRSLAQQWIVPDRLRRLNAAVYHSPYYLMPYSTGVPTVLTAYDVIPLHPLAGFSRRQRWLYWAAHLLAFNASDRIITLSQAARADFIVRFKLPAEEVVVVAPGLTANFAPPSQETIHTVRMTYNLPEEYVLYVGSNKPHKNLPALIQAYATLPATAPPLVLAGPEDARFPQMRQAAAPLGQRVRLLGRIPDADLPGLYAGATLYVQPSLIEGFGFPVLEAFGCGAPVACADIPVLRELAQSAALYFDPRRPDTIAHTLAEALESPDTRTALRERGQLRARAFTWERAALQTLEVYRQLTG